MSTVKVSSRMSGSRAVAVVSALLTALAMMVLVPATARADAVTITSFSPLAGAPTTSLVITGTGLDTAVGVSIGGHSARFVTNSPTSITATVGYNDATGLVRVTDLSGSVLAASTRSFTVLPGVVPSTAKPAPNSPFTLSGAGFGRSEQVIVSIGGAVVSSAFTTDGTFVDNFTMPGNLVPGSYQVTAVGHDSTATASTTIYIYDNWANPSGGPNSNGANENEIVLGAGNVSGLHETWAKYLNSVSGNTLAVADGTAYIATSLVGNTGTSILYAWPERGGALRWQFALPGKQMRGPVYANNVVYVAAYQPETSTQPLVTTYYALNAKTGAVIWTRTVNTAYANTMVVSDGMLFATLFSSPANLLIAMNTSDGSTAWSHTFGNVIFGPAVSGGRVFVASSNADEGVSTGSIVAMQEFSGTNAWSTAVAPGEFTQPVVSGDRVYYSVIAGTGATVLRSAVPRRASPCGAIRWCSTCGRNRRSTRESSTSVPTRRTTPPSRLGWTSRRARRRGVACGRQALVSSRQSPPQTESLSRRVTTGSSMR